MLGQHNCTQVLYRLLRMPLTVDNQVIIPVFLRQFITGILAGADWLAGEDEMRFAGTAGAGHARGTYGAHGG